nr:carbohydrate porin [uncultured Enterobacter sp.]
MKKTVLAVAIGLCAVSNATWASTDSDDIEQRLQQLERRLAAAEERATVAENHVQQMKLEQAVEIQEIKAAQGNVRVDGTVANDEMRKNATTPSLDLTGYGDIKFYGDVEFNMDAESRKGSLITNRDDSIEQWNLNGRILLGFDGVRRMDNGYYAGFSAQPLADMTGSVDLDDAHFYFGQENDWRIKIGRFEAFDMFPLNQDTFVEHTGNTANDLYDDGHGYIYMMKEGRGRSDSGGNFMLSKQVDNWYFELNSLIEDGSDLYADREYHGKELTTEKNVAYLRPVISYSEGAFSAAAAMEANVVNNAYGFRDTNGQWVDQSQRTGYGLTMTWNGQKADPENGIVTNLNVAYMDATDEKDFTAAINSLWKRFELGYIYAHNEVEAYNGSSFATCDDDCWITEEGKYDIHTIHASYLFPFVMDMENFNIYLGAYYSKLESDSKNSSDDDRYGARVRFKYYF